MPPPSGSSSGPPATPTEPTGGSSPTPASGEAIPVRQDALEVGLDIQMAPGPDGTLFVSIPRVDGSVQLVRLDASGRAMTGWPIALEGARVCSRPVVFANASVRLVCQPVELNQELNVGTRVAAFDGTGHPLAGWPVDVYGRVVAARSIGQDLRLLMFVPLGDVIEEGVPTHAVSLVSLAPDGEIVEGAVLTLFDSDAEQWAIGPDGIAYGTTYVFGSGESSRITALGLAGPSAGGPTIVDGLASGLGIGPNDELVMALGSRVRNSTRIASFDPTGTRPPASSGELPTASMGIGETGGCGIENPDIPIVASDGTVVLLSWARDQVFALDPTLVSLRGWPYDAPAPFMRLDPRHVREDAFCPDRSVPAFGPDGTLYLALQPHNQTVGSSLVALGSKGEIRQGWPVELRQAGAEFWSIAVGADGVVHALAIEPETATTSSATVVAFAPDSTVIYRTTVIEP